MSAETQAIQALLDVVQDKTLPFFTAVAGVGVLSMAILQTVKDLTPMRSWFQAWWIRGWLADKCAQSSGPDRMQLEPASPVRAERDLVLLSTDGDRDALYDLAIEQLCGQMNVAAQSALDHPGRYRDLLLSLACRAEPEDVRRVLEPPPREGPKENVPPERLQPYVDARNRVTQQIQRAIDAVQISMGFRWKFLLQVAAFVLSGAITAVGVASQRPAGWNATSIVAIAVLGGFLAPVARDLVASVQQLRK
jgi:hypothetical protein